MKNINKMIIIAGLGCGKGFYCNVVKEFSKTFNNIEIIELRNVDNLEGELLDKLGNQTEPFVILGHCFGGALFCKVLGEEKYKNYNLKALILCNSYYSFRHLSFQTIIENEERLGDYLEKYPFLKENEKGCFEKELTFRLIDKIFGKFECKEAFENIDVNLPILMIASSKDGYFSESKYWEMFDLMNDKRASLDIFNHYIYISNARHLGLLTNASEYMKTTNHFLECEEIM